jgi:hypothetical protein
MHPSPEIINSHDEFDFSATCAFADEWVGSVGNSIVFGAKALVAGVSLRAFSDARSGR